MTQQQKLPFWATGNRINACNLSIFYRRVEHKLHKFYHTIPNFIAGFAYQVSLHFKNKIYTFKFLVGVGAILHLKIELSTFLYCS